jgi:RimJ/RimL family protein N-acetyltransferase
MKIFADNVIETERLYLEPLEVKHAELLYDSLQNKDLYTYISEKPPDDISKLVERYRILEQRESPGRDEIWLNWAIRIKNELKYAGTVQATVYRNQEASIGYILFTEYQKMGFAFECCSKLLELLFLGYNIQRITAQVDKQNAPSIKLLEKTGFIAIGESADERDYLFEQDVVFFKARAK